MALWRGTHSYLVAVQLPRRPHPQAIICNPTETQLPPHSITCFSCDPPFQPSFCVPPRSPSSQPRTHPLIAPYHVPDTLPSLVPIPFSPLTAPIFLHVAPFSQSPGPCRHRWHQIGRHSFRPASCLLSCPGCLLQGTTKHQHRPIPALPQSRTGPVLTGSTAAVLGPTHKKGRGRTAAAVVLQQQLMVR